MWPAVARGEMHARDQVNTLDRVNIVSMWIMGENFTNKHPWREKNLAEYL